MSQLHEDRKELYYELGLNSVQNYTIGTEEYVSLDSYWDAQKLCREVVRNCPDVSEDAASKLSFAFALIVAILNISQVQFYNGPFQEEIPTNLPSFSMLEVPTISLPFVSIKIPKIWSDSAELVRTLCIMAKAYSNASPETFVTVKKKYDSLPWGWTEQFSRRDFMEVDQALEFQVKEGDSSLRWELTGPIEKIYPSLKNILQVQRVSDYGIPIQFILILTGDRTANVVCAYITLKSTVSLYEKCLLIFKDSLKSILSINKDEKDIILKEASSDMKIFPFLSLSTKLTVEDLGRLNFQVVSNLEELKKVIGNFFPMFPLS